MNKFYVSERLSEHMAETPDGFLICYDVPVARIGEQVYKADEVPIEPDSRGLVIIKRREEEVFNPDAIMSFEGKPFTIDHPDEAVTPENWGEYANGFIVNVRRGARELGNFLIGDIVVTTQKAIERIKNGEREISCGYDADYKQLEKGVGIQKNIIGNHIALVDKGRAGHRCAIGDKSHECTNCGNCRKKVIKEVKVIDQNISLEEEDKDDMKKRKLKVRDRFLKIYRKRMKDADFEKLPEEEKMNAIADEIEKEEEIASDDLPLEEEKKGDDLLEKKEESADEGEEAVVEEVEEEAEKEVVVTPEKMYAMMERLVGIVEAFVKAAATGDKKTVDEEKEEVVKDEEEKATEDEEEEVETKDDEEKEEVVKDEEEKATEDEEEEEEKKASDAKTCDSIWNDVAYRADLLYPGITLNKPTKDHMVEIDSLKRKALRKALTTDSSDAVRGIIGNKDIKKLKNEALDIAFMAVSEAVKNKNNKFVTDSVIKNTKQVTNDIQTIQKKHEEFWKRK